MDTHYIDLQILQVLKIINHNIDMIYIYIQYSISDSFKFHVCWLYAYSSMYLRVPGSLGSTRYIILYCAIRNPKTTFQVQSKNEQLHKCSECKCIYIYNVWATTSFECLNDQSSFSFPPFSQSLQVLFASQQTHHERRVLHEGDSVGEASAHLSVENRSRSQSHLEDLLIGQKKHSYRQLLDFQVPTAQRFTTFAKPPVTSKCYTAEHVFTDQHKTLVVRPKASSSEDKSDTGSHCPSENAELDIDVGWYGSLWLGETSHFQSSTYAKGPKVGVQHNKSSNV